MGARLSDKQKKKIIADYSITENYSATAKLNDVSRTTVSRVVSESADLDSLLQQKKEQNTADILAYMERQRDIVCEIIGKGLNALNDDEKLAAASPTQITTALGTLIDKWTMISGRTADTVEEDELSKSLKELAEGLESDDK